MYQQITLVGNVGTDPEMRYLSSGVAVTNFTLAVNKSWTNANGEKQEKTVWFRVACWRKLAEVVGQHVHKGRKLLVVGEVEEASTWTDKDGNPRATIEVTATVVKFLDRNGQGTESTGDSDSAGGDAELPEFD